MTNNGTREWLEDRVAVLTTSSDPSELEVAASQLAASDNPNALLRLTEFLSNAEFLRKLDEGLEPGEPSFRLKIVMTPLINRPSPEVAELCLKLADNPVYEEDDKKDLLLRALARVTPMSAGAADFFRRTNEEGYFLFNARLLAENASTAALDFFRSMMLDRNIAVEERVDAMHISILPQRTRLPILKLASELLSSNLEEPVATAVVESVFHFERRWFGTHGPELPPWRSAPNNVLELLIKLGDQARGVPNLPEHLQSAIDTTAEIARALLSGRNP